MFISVVIPVHNEVESLKELDYRLHNALKEEKIINDYQLIYVDDGSNDGSNKLLNLHNKFLINYLLFNRQPYFFRHCTIKAQCA